jgi:hypothetical protein
MYGIQSAVRLLEVGRSDAHPAMARAITRGCASAAPRAGQDPESRHLSIWLALGYGTQHFVVGVLADTIPSFQTTNRGAICFIC